MSGSGSSSLSSATRPPAAAPPVGEPHAAAASTYADWLRAHDDAWLGELLRLRPDAARPAPTDLGTLAVRLVGSISVGRALDQLDASVLQLVEVMVVSPNPIAAAELATRLPELTAEELAAGLARLTALGLVWGVDDALHLVDNAAAMIRYPCGLGRPLAELIGFGPGSADVDRLVDSLPNLAGDEAALVRRLAAGPPLGRIPDDWSANERPPGPIRRLLSRRILVQLNDVTVELPRELGLAVRGETPFGPLRARPVPTAGTVNAARLDTLAAGAIIGVLQQVEDLLTGLDAGPASALRSGGIGVREHRRLARSAHLDESTAALLLEISLAAGLVGVGADGEHWLPTRLFDVWIDQTLADRWIVLAGGWLAMGRQPALAGRRDVAGRVLAPLSPDLIRHGAPVVRRAVLEPLLATKPGSSWLSDDLLALMAWMSPRRGADFVEGARDALAEARVLGIVADDALTRPGRALLSGAADLDQVVGGVLPPLIDHVLLQPDLSAVAPGPLEPELARSLSLVADVESSGGATVYRISAASLRRSLDAGWSAQDLHAFFALHSRTPVPQTLTYLIDDLARRHGGIRVGAASTYLRSDDETLVAQVAADRRLADYELRVLAPGVLISTADPDTVLEALREAGYVPAAESPAGAVLTGHAARVRAPGRRSSPAPRPTDLTSEQVEIVVRQMRAGDTALRAPRRGPLVPPIPGATTATILETLQRAIREDEGLWIGYVNAEGQASERLVEPLSLTGGFLRAYDHRREEPRTFAVHRITAVTSAND